MGGSIHPFVEERHRLHQLDGIHGLHEMHALQIVKGRARDGDDRGPIERRIVEAIQQVHGAGAGGSDTDPEPPGCFAMPLAIHAADSSWRTPI